MLLSDNSATRTGNTVLYVITVSKRRNFLLFRRNFRHLAHKFYGYVAKPFPVSIPLRIRLAKAKMTPDVAP